MKCYLNRVKCDTHSEMFNLIMSRLTGKARDVVKVSRRSRPELSATDLPTAVFDILKGNFSELSYSNLPMKDFYSTIPRANERLWIAGSPSMQLMSASGGEVDLWRTPVLKR